MDTFNEHDYATAKGFNTADEAYIDLWYKSMEAQEYDALRHDIEVIYELQEKSHRTNSQS
jgi:hypothetical protein